MTSREQFEAWIKSETDFDLWRTNYPMTKPEDQQYKDHSTNLAWMAWQASREAVEVELPSLKQIDSGERYVWSDGVFNFKEDAIKEIRAAGIKVKGE